MGLDLDEEQAAPPYAPFLQTKWIEIIDLSIEVRKKLLMDEIDSELIADFGSRVSRMWQEIEPKVRGRDDFSEKEAFKGFKQFCEDPLATFAGKKQNQIPKETIMLLFKIELALGEALDFLKITTW